MRKNIQSTSSSEETPVHSHWGEDEQMSTMQQNIQSSRTSKEATADTQWGEDA